MVNTELHNNRMPPEPQYNPIPPEPPQNNQPVEIQSFFNSEGRNVYAFSDIHADINVLIILLRDLAGVIRKRNGVFDQNVIDQELEPMLNIDIKDNDNGYDETLGYEWIPGNNSYVVIIGDILDGIRTGENEMDSTPLNNITNAPDHYYPQVEIKILRFINAINIQATQNHGKIFKLFGNHEIGNINNTLIDNYAFKNDLGLPNYYRGCTRRNVFEKGKAGFNELIREGCRVFLVIDNYIFIHGQLFNKTYDLLHTYTNKLNNTSTSDQDFNSTIEILNDDDTSELWLRDYSHDEKIHDRHLNNSTFCNRVNTHFKKFITPQFSQISGINDPKELKIVIGHCPQSYSSIYRLTNKTFTQVIQQDPTKEILRGESIPSKGSFQYVSPISNRIFGITMECENVNNSHKVFRVDVGSARTFDQPNAYNLVLNQYQGDDPNIHNRERLYLFSRTPQLLHINSNTEQIIRSKIKNTRIHQPRSQYENYISNIGDSPLKLTNQNYQKKYLKYKQKYLELKKLLN